MTTEEVRAKLRDWIARERPLLVVVFGSALEGPAGPEPDLDLAVLFGRTVDPIQAIQGLAEALGRDDVDLMVLDHADPIARLAASRGEPVHESEPGRFVRFASLATRQFMDSGKLARARRELTDAFLRERGFA
jgi:predicted nucleotidyltransferase